MFKDKNELKIIKSLKNTSGLKFRCVLYLTEYLIINNGEKHDIYSLKDGHKITTWDYDKLERELENESDCYFIRFEKRNNIGGW